MAVLAETTKGMNGANDGSISPGEAVNMSDIVNGGVEKGRYIPQGKSEPDYKMSVSLVDKSLDDTTDILTLHIFHPALDQLPSFSLADVLVIKRVLVQKTKNDSYPSLLSCMGTTIDIFRANPSLPSKINISSRWAHSREGKPSSASQNSRFSPGEAAYAAYLHNHINRGVLPDVVSFGADYEKSKAVAVRDKRKELKDVEHFQFYDLLVNVVADPVDHQHGFKTYLWVSDYTENPGFKDQNPGQAGAKGLGSGQVGDPNDYLTRFGGKGHDKDTKDVPKEWLGPTGRRSMGITCHNSVCHDIKELKIGRGSWIKLFNVRIESYNGVLKGHLDESDRGKILVEVVSTKDADPDQRLIDALRRKFTYEKAARANKRKRKEMHDGSNGPNNTAKPLNSREKRKLQRAAGAKGANGVNGANGQTTTMGVVPLTDVPNPSITANPSDRPIVPLWRVLEPGLYEAPSGVSECLQLPFANVRFKTQVRVVDFMPTNLLNFAVSRRVSEFEILKEYATNTAAEESLDDDEDSSEDDGGSGERVWEWRFALCLEDVSLPTQNNGGSNTTQPARVWAVVDNYFGQMLIGDDACDLRKNKENRGRLCHKLSLLWGNLEETKKDTKDRAILEKDARGLKAKEAARQKEAAEEAARVAEKERQRKEAEKDAARKRREKERQQAAANGRTLAHYAAPDDADSDDDDNGNADADAKSAEAPVQSTDPKVLAKLAEIEASLAKPAQKLSNRPFVCYLHQYGIPTFDVPDEEGGEPERGWQRMFGLFDTTISN